MMRVRSTPVLDRPLRMRIGIAAVLAALLALAVALVARPAEPADAAKAKTIGKTKSTPNPSCPGDPCEAIGSVTGFQQSADGDNGVFKAPSDGHVVAWSTDLSKPDKSQREFFGEFYKDNEFGTDPAARLAILKGKGKSEFKLKSQSPAVPLRSELGNTPVITLNDPLRVKKGDVIGLTIPTWLPNFAVEQARDDYWRASRSPKKCTGEADIKDSRPQTEVGSSRRYGCRYTTARLVYWAYMVKDGGGGGGGGGGNGGGGNGGGGNGGGGNN
jgi:hypothetical protein